MFTSRRELARLLSGAGSLTLIQALSSGPSANAAARSALGSTPIFTASLQQEDGNTHDFWTKQIRDPHASRTRSIDHNPPQASFLYFDPKDGFVTGSDISDVGLPDRGDLNLLVHVDHIHLSLSDQSRIGETQGGSLRIDLQQAEPLPSLAERLSWTAIAGLIPDPATALATKDMAFNPGTTWGKMQTVIMPGGGGSWTWNFFLQHRKSRWMQLLEMLRKDQKALLPLFGIGLPAIAVTALQTVDSLVGELTRSAATDWLFQSSDAFIYSTRQSKESFEGSKLRIKQGMYVILPSDRLSTFSTAQSHLQIKDGFIVPRGTRSIDVLEASRHTLPDVSYMTVGVKQRITPAVRMS